MLATGEIRTFREAVAIVTGAGSGIGAALARTLAARGATVIAADRDGGGATETTRTISAAGGRAEAAEVDVRDPDRVAQVVNHAAERHGRLDYLFNNAGIGVGGEILDCDVDDWRYIVDVNVMGVVHGIHAAYPRMVRQGFGHIVSTASMAGLMPSPFAGAYSATKHAVVGLTRALRVEAAAYGVRVSAFCPGVIRTPILKGGRYGRLKIGAPTEQQLAVWERLRPMDPDRFAAAALDQVRANREIIIVPGWWRLIWWLNRLAPGFGAALAARGFREMKALADELKRRA
jgi:NAD(P)-dependent dehydrogenase (short-subunit alcohol dehydrogenase family)